MTTKPKPEQTSKKDAQKRQKQKAKCKISETCLNTLVIIMKNGLNLRAHQNELRKQNKLHLPLFANHNKHT